MNQKTTSPADSQTRFLNKKRSYVTEKTIHNYDTTLRQFLNGERIADLRDVTNDTITRFEEYCLRSAKPVTCRNDIRIVKNFIRCSGKTRKKATTSAISSGYVSSGRART